MRISTVTMFDQSVASMNRQQSDFLKVGQQIASGRRVVNPSDDPQAASRSVGVSQAMAVTQQYADARVTARNSLAQAESVLNSVADAITSAKTLLVQAASDTLSDVDRQSVASELRGIYETLIGQANATDGNGRYLFGGYQDNSPPFARTAGEGVSGVNYVGDTNTREQRIDASRLMPVADNGKTIFQSVPSGAGYVARAEKASPGNISIGTQPDHVRNEGSVAFTSGPNRVDPNNADFGKPFELEFSSDVDGNPVYSVSVVEEDGTRTPIVTDATYVSGRTVSFGGVNITLEGTPVDGDQIQLRPANNENANQDLFKSLKDAIDLLELDQGGMDDNRAHFRNTVNTVMRELDNSLDNVLTVRASMGARLNELDVVDAVGGNRMMNYEQTLSDLVDLDYSKAIAEYSLRQVGLQAAQKAFVDVKGLSLFNFL
ncbi:flagellar hook-associated protein 3 [Billgrantia tianxiuensis]|jgi:flagellar hook-associated protein 3 FlgL|uniref:Flagellar hook-associated protein 3 n=1 Tax=Billgrantia tianxiuensis TaxID=2497861 RepID=A0A6I6SI92_9GAMM|nr:MULTISPECIES: flagellar hook-associated protein FlgL [Halomonas]MCE8034543.1 flagellar hook-associated protein FlgL [Halomonas sp. MCCC 1A11057]QHC50418.1 flagellar hook-associated protein 3 [Halomonas tianxiuensis]